MGALGTTAVNVFRVEVHVTAYSSNKLMEYKILSESGELRATATQPGSVPWLSQVIIFNGKQ